MIHDNNEIIDNSSFKQFRNRNLYLISSINSTVESIISEINIDEITINEKIALLDTQIKELTAIYLSFHSMTGTKTILNLQSLIRKYKNEAIENHRRINAASFLIKKMNQLISEDNFSGPEPFRNIPFSTSPDFKTDKNKNVNRTTAFKWITFKRNNSWFITEFSSLEIVNLAGSDISKSNKGGIIIKTVNNIDYYGIDLMNTPGRDNDPPLLIRPHNGGLYFAADKKGKEIYSSGDFISPMINKFRNIKNSYINGRLRIFGINHLYLINNQCMVDSANKNCAGA